MSWRTCLRPCLRCRPNSIPQIKEMANDLPCILHSLVHVQRKTLFWVFLLHVSLSLSLVCLTSTYFPSLWNFFIIQV
jgi:methylphosphotriester-DNA--protein-cysteine methyltransferase